MLLRCRVYGMGCSNFFVVNHLDLLAVTSLHPLNAGQLFTKYLP